MKKIQITALLLWLSISVFAQSVSPKVMPAAGGNFTAGGVTFSFTIGQTFNATLTGGSYTVTQGFQQPKVASLAVATTGSATSGCVGTSASLATQVTGGSGNYTYAWSGPNSYTATTAAPSFTVATTSTGTYTVTVTDNSNSATATATASFTALALPALVITPTASTLTCAVTSTTLNATGGATYLWNTTATTAAITVTSANTYTLTATAVNGCTASASRTINSNTTAPTAAITPSTTTLTCTTVSATLTATGGASYAWNNSTTNAVRTVTSAGTYSVTATGSNGCTATAFTTITQNTTPPVAHISATSQELNCVVSSATLTGSGGVSYYWNSGDTTQSITTSVATGYFLVVTAANGCQATASMTLADNHAPPLAIFSGGFPINCYNPVTTVTVNDGYYYGYTYQWILNGANVSTDSSFTTSTGGAYIVNVTGTNGCVTTDSLHVYKDISLPDATITATADTVTCAIPAVGLTVASGASDYAWNDGYIFNSRPATGGPYSVTITGANGCTSTGSINIVVDNTLPDGTITASDGLALNCNTASTVLSVPAAASYMWYQDGNFVSTASSISVSSPANYDVAVTGANGCVSGSSVVVTADFTAPAPFIVPSVNPITCTTPTATLTVTDGISVFWSDGNTSMVRTVSAGGSYSVIATGANGCTASAALVLTEALTVPDPTITSSTGAVLNCQNTSTVLSVAAADAYYWELDGLQISTAQSFTTTTAGTYTVSVTNPGGCTATASYVITQSNAGLTATITAGTNNLDCNTRTTTLTASGGVSYLWDNGSTALSIVVDSANTYHLTAFDSNGCQASTYTVINSNFYAPSSTIYNVYGYELRCDNPESWIFVPAGQNLYEWTLGGTVVGTDYMYHATVAGTYTVSITDYNGCTATSSVVVTSNYVYPTVTISSNATALTCNRSTIDLTASGADQYFWNTSDTGAVLTATGAYTYTVLGFAANGCSASASITIQDSTAAPDMTISASNGLNLNCSTLNTVLSIPANGGTYTWTYGGAIVSTSNSVVADMDGYYIVSSTGPNGCTDVNWQFVSVDNTPPSLNLTTTADTLTCATLSSSLTATGGDSYVWDNTTTNAIRTVASAGTYTVIATSASNGCTASASTTISSNTTAPVAGITPSATTLTCTTLSSDLTATGGDSYIWDNTTTNATRTVTSAGTYTVIATSASNGCTASASTTINSNTTAPVAGITPSATTLTCATVASGLTATGGDSYVWDNSTTNATRTVTSSGTYTVIATSASNGCTASATTTINSNTTAPTVSVSPVSSVLSCTSTSAVLTATTNGVSYVWDNSSTSATRTVSLPGTYSVTAMAANGCTASASAGVSSSIGLPNVSLSPISGVLTCSTTSFTLNASSLNSGATFNWGTSTNSALTVTAPGTYAVTVTDPSTGCTVSASAVITQNITPPSAVITPSGATTICAPASVSLSIPTGNTYAWSTTATTASITVNTSGTYSATVTAANGCTATATPVTVTVNTAPVINCPSPVTINAGANSCGINQNLSVAASGLPSPIVTFSPASGSFFNAGVTSVTATATNSCGTATCSYNVTVTMNDPTAPVSSVTNNSATLGWTSGNGGNGYQMKYQSGAAVFNPATTGTSNTGTGSTANLTGLTPSTTYRWYVREVCGGVFSNWLSGGTFTTNATAPPVNDDLCAAVTLPNLNTQQVGFSTYGIFTGLNCNLITQSNASASQALNEPANPSCADGVTGNHKTLWYKFTTPACSVGGTVPFTMKFSTDNIGTVLTANTYIEIFSSSTGTCGGVLTSVVCNNDYSTPGCSPSGNTSASTIVSTATLTAGTTYFLRVGNYSVTAPGGNIALSMSIEPSAPVVTANAAAPTDKFDVNVTASGASNYAYYYRPLGNAGYSFFLTTTPSFTSPQLVPGTTYQVMAVHRCTPTTQFFGTPVTNYTVPAYTACTAPSPLVCGTNNTSSTLSFSWPSQANLYTIGGTTSGYVIYWRIHGAAGYNYVANFVPTSCTGGTCTGMLTGLVPGTTYDVWVGARCSSTTILYTNTITCATSPAAAPRTTAAAPKGDDLYTFAINGIEYHDVNLSDNWNNFGLPVPTTGEAYFDFSTGKGRVLNHEGGIELSPSAFAPAAVSDLNFDLVPNPASSQTTVVIYTPETTSAICTVYDLQGHTVAQEMIAEATNGTAVRIATDHLSAGVYMVAVKTEANMITKRLVIVK